MQLWLDDDVVSAQNKVGSLVVGGLCPPALPSTVSGQLSIQTPVCIVSLPTAPILHTTRRSLAPFSGLAFPVDTRLEGVQLEDAFFQLFPEAFEQLSVLSRRGRVPFLKRMHARVVGHDPFARKRRVWIVQAAAQMCR